MAVMSKPETSLENRVAGWLTPEEFSILEAGTLSEARNTYFQRFGYYRPGRQRFRGRYDGKLDNISASSFRGA